jgi:hypothetical protein
MKRTAAKSRTRIYPTRNDRSYREPDVCTLLEDSVKTNLTPPEQTPLERGLESDQDRRTPKLVKALLFLGISSLGLLGIRLLPATASDGWVPTVALVAGLGLITMA